MSELNPITREEQFLAKAAGYDVEPPKPITRTEMFLQKISDRPGTGGGGDVDLGVTGAIVGQTVKISAVDENGTPTAWEPVEFPSGGGSSENDNDWELINELTIGEEGITSFLFDKDKNGNSFELSDLKIHSDYQFSLGGTSASGARTNLIFNGKTAIYSIGNISASKRYLIIYATTIDGRIWFGSGNFTSDNDVNSPKSIAPFGTDNTLWNDKSITSVGINILNPGEEYFAVGYHLTLWGRRKK